GKPFEPRVQPETTILSCSLADFTTIASFCNPQEVMNMLNELNNRFDRLIKMRQLHLVHSLADSWLVVSWAPERCRSSCTSSMLDLALAMAAEARQIVVRHFGLPLRVSATVIADQGDVVRDVSSVT
ncbi:hypothetical protein PMAYCL1PPCAC_14980, partial [Pristionchus mayeri]